MSKIEVIHYRDKGEDPKGGVTFAYRFDEDTRKIKFAIAACRDTDNYSKKKGFALAKSRLELSDLFPTTVGVVEFSFMEAVTAKVRADVECLNGWYDFRIKAPADQKETNIHAMTSWMATFVAINANRTFIEELIVDKAREVYKGRNPYLF